MNNFTPNRGRAVRLTVCVVVSGVCFYLAVRGMDFARALQELQKSSPVPIVGAVVFLFLSFWIRAYRWSYLLLPVKQIATRPLFRFTVIGFMNIRITSDILSHAEKLDLAFFEDPAKRDLLDRAQQNPAEPFMGFVVELQSAATNLLQTVS